MLKIGDRVVMNDKYHVSKKDKMRVWTVKSKPWMCCGSLIVLLDGELGGYAVDGLDLIDDNAEGAEKDG